MKKSGFLLTVILAFLIGPMFILNGNTQDEEQGDLIYIIADNVSPSNFPEYEKWIKEFKALADATGAPSYGAGQNESGISYFMNVGKNMTGYDELNKKFGEWFSSNPDAAELEKKYGHTRNFTEVSLWRHNPSQSYVPEGYDNTISRTYTRVSTSWIKSGQVETANEIIAEFKATWAEAGINASTNSYWNVFGEEQACVVFVTNYENREAWMADMAEVMEKIGQEKVGAIVAKWNAVLRKSEESESTGRPDLAHSNE